MLPAGQNLMQDLAFHYYPSSYANSPEIIRVKLYRGAQNLLKSTFYWRLEFTLLDREDLPIAKYRPTEIHFAVSSVTRWDERTYEYIFNMNREAYENMQTIRLTNVAFGHIY
jgi:hypothetical protein